MTDQITSQEINDINAHLKERGLDPSRTKVIIDMENNMATFMLYNLSGQLVGYQKYDPNGSKKVRNGELAGKYFTYVTKESDKSAKLAVWGTENIDPNNKELFITEGIFDAIKLQNAGKPVIAVLTNNPAVLKPWLFSLNKKKIAIIDNDDAGRRLAKFADEHYTAPEGFKDLGEMSQEQVNTFLTNIGYPPEKKSSGEIEVRHIETPEELDIAKDQITNQHYIKRWPRAVQAVLGVFKDGEQIGTLVYGIGTRAQSTKEIFQNPDGTPVIQNNQMWELQRAFTTDEAKKEVPNLGSMVISRGNEWIRQNAKTKDGLPIKAIISYADSSVGHKGSVYQSTNATYLGEQKPLPAWLVTNPANGNIVRRSKISQDEYKILTDRGYTIEKTTPETGKHKFVYALGKDQNERDQLLSKIVVPVYDYPKEGEPPRQITNAAKERVSKKQTTAPIPQQPDNKRELITKLLNSKVKNPETNNDILVKTALKYDKNHPSYKQARGMVNAYSKKYGIRVKDTR